MYELKGELVNEFALTGNSLNIYFFNSIVQANSHAFSDKIRVKIGIPKIYRPYNHDQFLINSSSL